MREVHLFGFLHTQTVAGKQGIASHTSKTALDENRCDDDTSLCKHMCEVSKCLWLVVILRGVCMWITRPYTITYTTQSKLGISSFGIKYSNLNR